ncbi:CRISPR system precrRNA processing endoribonuclease RAMP protein Cas6 [Kutzneria buriramensis]|uniref:CRISPR-associated endoribonuclease Cas6 n=1 Tax=Kutzneria buriramensis TaxID=1045776 RepID=A0A3E0HLL1_9PSEU|nr:CRISPR system precrRNA processing endoribonuclease RAMP protein Cas6 [Kutzneria buriramensis]REH47339.1 CRISPR-associated endoribonuclease Cas6 [Kutzneria buriramensis]
MPSLWRLTLAQPGPTLDRRTVYRMLARCLDTDHHANRKPWSWTARREPGSLVVEVGLLDDTLADRLITGVEDTRRRHAPAAGRPTGVHQIAACTWAQLLHGPVTTEWAFRFISPVTFRRGNRFLPWPAPSAVLGSLRASWRTFAPADIADVTVDLSGDPIVVTGVDGTTTVEQVVLHDRADSTGTRRPVSVAVGGFSGQVRFAVDTPGFDPTGVTALARLAPFSGIGAYTTRGFGGARAPRPAGQAARVG